MNLIEQAPYFITMLESRLKPNRFQHSLNVAQSAVELAQRFGADEDKAYISGLLHDITKNDSYEKQLQIMEEHGILLTEVEENNPKLWHAISGSLFVQDVFGINDEEIIGAIRFHTTGKAGMTLLEKVIFIADYISAERDYKDVDVMRRLSNISLEQASLYALKFSLSSLSEKQKPIHVDSLAYYNELVIQTSKGLI